MIFSKRGARDVQEAYAKGVEDGRKFAAEKFGWSIFDIPDEAIAARELSELAHGDLRDLRNSFDGVMKRIQQRINDLERNSSKVGSLRDS